MIILSKNNIYYLIIVVVMLFASNLCAAPEEKLTITTYFPAPYGSYKELTTTGHTYLATSSGNVGIGTAVPQDLLQVGTSPSPGLLVQSSGNVGIGITNPSGYRLYVNGDLYIQGTLSHPNSNPPAVGGACPSPGSCTITLCQGTCPPICTITIQDGIIIDSTCG